MSTLDAIDKFKARYPKLISAFTISDDTLQVFLEESAIEISKCAFGAYYKKALFTLTAHNLVLEEYANASALDPASANAAFTAVGGISSASVGDVSLSRNLAAGDNSSEGNLQATLFGQEFLRVRKKMGTGALVARDRVFDASCASTEVPTIIL